MREALHLLQGWNVFSKHEKRPGREPGRSSESPLLDLKEQYAGIRDEVRAALNEVLESQQFTLGPKVRKSKRWRRPTADAAMRWGILGNRALLIALMSAGVGPGMGGDHSSFFATAGMIARLGARPVFVDISLDI